MGRYVARHVVTTTKTMPSAGAATRADETVQDGWYLDLETGCQDASGRTVWTRPLPKVVEPSTS